MDEQQLMAALELFRAELARRAVICNHAAAVRDKAVQEFEQAHAAWSAADSAVRALKAMLSD